MKILITTVEINFFNFFFNGYFVWEIENSFSRDENNLTNSHPGLLNSDI